MDVLLRQEGSGGLLVDLRHQSLVELFNDATQNVPILHDLGERDVILQSDPQQLLEPSLRRILSFDACRFELL